MEFASKNLTVGQLNALVKTLGGENIVRGILDRTTKFVVQVAEVEYELYRHEKQADDGWIGGFDLEKHLRKEKPEVFETSLESEQVKGWLANPSTYPEELKGIYPCLWGSAQDRGGYRGVPCLVWLDDEVDVYWRWFWLDRDFHRPRPALLASST